MAPILQVSDTLSTGNSGGDLVLLALAIGWVVAVTGLFYRHLRDQITAALQSIADREAAHREEIRALRAEHRAELAQKDAQLETARAELLKQTLATAETNAVNAETNKMLVEIVDRTIGQSGRKAAAEQRGS